VLTRLPLSDSFALAWEHDPAFDRTSDTFAHDYEVACETLDWAKLCHSGKQPTLFHFRPLSGMPTRRLIDADIGHMERVALAFRMALTRVENGEGLPDLKRAVDSQHAELGPMANLELVDYLDALPVAVGAPFGHIVTSLGGMAINRSLNLAPRS
jgi:hypothetical protein